MNILATQILTRLKISICCSVLAVAVVYRKIDKVAAVVKFLKNYVIF